jgi:hypothetical protein
MIIVLPALAVKIGGALLLAGLAAVVGKALRK